MKDCPRCGFLNPDRTTHCMKCRFNFDPQPEEPRFEGPGGRPPPDVKPDLLGPPPDLDDTFAGAGPLRGGYDQGESSQQAPAAVAPGDAFAVMTGRDAPSPDAGQKRRPAADRKLEKQLARQLKLPAAQAGAAGAVAAKAPTPKPAKPPKAPRPKVTMPKPDLSKLRDLVSARNVMTLLVAVLVLAALIYALTGSRYFQKPEQKTIDASIAAMGGLTSYKVSSALVMAHEGLPPFPGTDSMITGKNAFSASYSFSEPGVAAPLTIIEAGGKTYVSKAGGPWTGTTDYGNLSFTAADLFDDTSSLRSAGTGTVDGVTCDRFTFTCSGKLLGSLVPGAKVESKRVQAEAWIEQSNKLLRHAKIGARMSSGEFDTFDCAADVSFSDFGTAPPVSSPVP